MKKYNLKIVRTIHYCNICDYKTDRRYDRDKHVQRKHSTYAGAPTTTLQPQVGYYWHERWFRKRVSGKLKWPLNS